MSLPESVDGAVTLQLLGAPALHVAGRQIPFLPARPYQLLAYLCGRGGWVARDALADLIYPGRPLEAARSNLRKVLHQARRIDGVGALEQRGDLLRWEPDSDLRRFERALDARQFGTAIELYRGPFLEGLDAEWPAGAASWLAAERARLESRWHDACTRHLAELAARPDDAAALAERLLRHDPLDEAALDAYARAQAARGGTALALRALADHAARLQAQLGVAPSVRLQALERALRDAGARSSTALGSARDDEPGAPGAEAAHQQAAHQQAVHQQAAPPAGLVGRRLELATIAARLADPGLRRLTLLGPGGIGKTTLARAALAAFSSASVAAPPAEAAASRAAAGAWVALGDDDTPDDVARRIAAVLDIQTATDAPPWMLLARALATPAGRQALPRLIVLDNAEAIVQRHGPALGQSLDGLLEAVPTLRVIVTSRTPLGGPGEHRLPVDGLPLPDADETDAALLRRNDAVRLFATRAAAVAPGFDLAREAADVVRLVHAVEGLPLALELLAPWRRYMPTGGIVAELAASADLLEAGAGPAAGGSAGERSLAASFERSWRMLGAAEQRTLAQVALLPAPLTRPMARQVLQATLPVLAALVDRSLLRVDDEGRFTLHPLVRRFAAPHAAPLADSAALFERHARDVAHRVGRAGLTHGAVLEAVGAEIDHVRAAWQWAVAHGDGGLILALAGPLGAYERTRGSWREASAAFETAAALLRARRLPGPGQVDAAALARVLANLADLQYARGLLDASAASAREVIALEPMLADRDAVADAILTLCSVTWQFERLDEALDWIGRYHASALSRGNRLQEAHARTTRGLILDGLGRHDEALLDCQAARALLQALGETAFLPVLLNNLGNLLRKMQRLGEAVQALREGLRWTDHHGVAKDRPWLLGNLAIALEDMGAFDEAAARLEEALAQLADGDEPYLRLFLLLAQGRVQAARGAAPAVAMAPLWQALGVATQSGLEWAQHEVVVSAARVWAHSGELQNAAALLQWVAAQDAAPPKVREAAHLQLARLAPGPQVLAQAAAGLPPALALAAVLATLPGASDVPSRAPQPSTSQQSIAAASARR